MHLITLLSITILFTHVAHGRNNTCKNGDTPCGPGKLCCTSKEFCNFNRAIPACEDDTKEFISGFGGQPCSDPYLYSCAAAIGTPGCCPIGTVCYTDKTLPGIICIDAYGVSAPAYPSAGTSTFTSTETPVPNSENTVIFSPASAWTTVPATENCTKSQTLHQTSQLNATITFNYTGPSILVHSILTPMGGRFTVTIDGMDTGSVIGTASNSSHSLPACSPAQFPPFVHPPPAYGSQDSHTITLTYIGLQDGTNGTITFDSFAIPEFNPMELSSSSGRGASPMGGILLGTIPVIGIAALNLIAL